MKLSSLPASLLLALTALGTACAPDSSDETPAAANETIPMPEIVINADDYSFSAPAEVPAGPVRIRIANTGMELHHVTLVRIPEGGSMEEMVAGTSESGAPEGYEFYGGPNAAAPGAELEAEVDLAAGTYGIVCVIPSPDGVPHLMKGMVGSFEAVAAEGQVATEETDLTLRLVDYGFTWDSPPQAGLHRIRIENGGNEVHEAVIARLVPGKTAQDLMAWAVQPEGPPPGEPLAGAALLHPGLSNVTEVDFTPGQYALLCFVLAPDGAPHVVHGMVQEFEIEA